MSKNRHKYIPAMGFDWLTPLYDIIMPPVMRESTIKPRLVEQMKVKKGYRILDRKMGSKGERKLPTSVVGIANPLPLTAILSHRSAKT